MIYHDMQYAQEGHAPANTTDQTKELQHQIRRLSNHPAIVMWDGCVSLTLQYSFVLYSLTLFFEHSRAERGLHIVFGKEENDVLCKLVCTMLTLISHTSMSPSQATSAMWLWGRQQPSTRRL